MKDKQLLLVVDGIINMALGILLIIFPTSMIRVLNLPKVETNFYINVLGAVLFGIGIALLMERFNDQLHIRGLGIAGAITINLFGAVTVMVWLMFGHLDLSTGGRIFLWSIALIVLGMAIIETLSKSWEEHE